MVCRGRFGPSVSAHTPDCRPRDHGFGFLSGGDFGLDAALHLAFQLAADVSPLLVQVGTALSCTLLGVALSRVGCELPGLFVCQHTYRTTFITLYFIIYEQ